MFRTTGPGPNLQPPSADTERGSGRKPFYSAERPPGMVTVMCRKEVECKNEVVKRKGRVESRKKNLEEGQRKLDNPYRGFSSFPSWNSATVTMCNSYQEKKRTSQSRTASNLRHNSSPTTATTSYFGRKTSLETKGREGGLGPGAMTIHTIGSDEKEKGDVPCWLR